MKDKLKSWRVWLPVLLAVAFIGGMWTGGALFSNHTGSKAINKLQKILSLIDSQYVDEIDVDSLLEQTFPDLLARLDPHSVYLTASDVASANEELSGSFYGIGVTFHLLNDTVTVSEVISGGPAEKAGLKPGDRIVMIDDSLAVGRQWSLDRIKSTLRGDLGTKVKVGIKRSTSSKILDYTIERGEIPLISVDAAHMLTDNVGYIRVNRFGSKTYMEFLNAVIELRAQGADTYVVDLRSNGGGYMEPAILMANEFLPAGAEIVSTRYRMSANDENIRADGTGSLRDAELVVLIDEYSASASEIFAGAIQDNDRGLVVGRRSFGKGLVQNQTELSDSSAIRLTIARYHTPSGRCIQKRYQPGNLADYESEIFERYISGETFTADSIKANTSEIFHTVGGRPVYGGGGIIPDVFVANDTSAVTSWYLEAVNAGLLNKFAFEMADTDRAILSEAETAEDLLNILPADEELLQRFVNFARSNGLAPRWYYINISRPLIVNQLKALIAREIVSTNAAFEIYNLDDPMVNRALEEIDAGGASIPIRQHQ